MPSKRALEADTYVDSLCLLAQATGATRKSDVGMKSAGDVGYILACKSSQCPVQFKVVITQGLSLQEGNEALWVADVEESILVSRRLSTRRVEFKPGPRGRLLCRKKIHPLLETAPACGVP